MQCYPLTQMAYNGCFSRIGVGAFLPTIDSARVIAPLDTA
jgi:hypothetical protein